MRLVFLAALIVSAYGQPAFEVASIRASQIGKAGGEGSRRENIQAAPGSLNMRNVSLKSCIRWAYHVMDYQVSGPGWLGFERFDIVAKAEGPASEEQLRAMMQALLAERFKLAVHRETKELTAYTLLVGKNGPKFHESTSEGETSIEPEKKTMTVTVQRAPVTQLVEMLANILHAPVLDHTELKGRYDITINIAKYLPEAGDASPDPIALIVTGLQQELGLKLESKKTPVDLVVVDHAEKVQVEN
jgi:uncharacterized protein (TIGR03435 family)